VSFNTKKYNFNEFFVIPKSRVGTPPILGFGIGENGRNFGIANTTDTRVSAIRSARRIRPNRVEFDLSGQRTRIPRVERTVCECVYTNQRHRLEHIRSGSARTPHSVNAALSWTYDISLAKVL